MWFCIRETYTSLAVCIQKSNVSCLREVIFHLCPDLVSHIWSTPSTPGFPSEKREMCMSWSKSRDGPQKWLRDGSFWHMRAGWVKWSCSTWRSKSSEGSSSCVQTPDCYLCMGENWEDRTRLFSVMDSDRTRRNVNKPRYKEFYLNIRTKPFQGRLKTGTDFPERFCCLYPWRYSKHISTCPWATCFSNRCLD